MTVPRVFGLPHLSEDAVAAFADGVLSPTATIRAERHCAECAECAAAVRGQREAAMMLRAAEAPSMPSGLMDRLAGVPMSAPLPPPRGGLPTVMGEDGVAMFATHKVEGPDREPNSVLRRGTLPMGLLASAAAVVAAGTLGSHLQSVAATVPNQPASASISQLTSSRNTATPRAASSPVLFSALSNNGPGLGIAVAHQTAASRPHFGVMRAMP
jgi:anti-sigma factor RsiW